MNDDRGSMWRKWDLHVHTPSSLFHRYGANVDTWERFVTALESLPKEFAVIGINDYLFLDGYRKILDYKSQGRLQNITTFLPVLEFRLANFAGTDGNLRRINYHVIFSNTLTADVIEQQFLNRLTSEYVLDTKYEHYWKGVLSRDALEDLGNKIISSAPIDRRSAYHAPLIEGFNNLNMSLASLREALDSSYFQNNFVTAIGKTEWASLKWTDQSIAEKKNLINHADCVFISSESSAAYENAKRTLTKQGVNDKLLDCSDAHGWPGTNDKDVIGNCELWIKADPTFRGLQHAIIEFNERVYVGTEPPKVTSYRNNAKYYIKSISCQKVEHAQLPQKWFDFSINLNPGLVAIIGNKGNGKSALADIIALGGNSSQDNHFSFLHKNKFRNPKENLSLSFEGNIQWENGDSRKFPLHAKHNTELTEQLRYIPQSYLEKLCNELANDGENAFSEELQSVIFSHLSIGQRLGKRNLRDLLSYKGEELIDRIANLRTDLSKHNKNIHDLETQSAPERRHEIELRLQAKQKELEALSNNKPALVSEPNDDPETSEKMEEIRERIDVIQAEADEHKDTLRTAENRQKELLVKLATAEKVMNRLRNIEDYLSQQSREMDEDLQTLDMQSSDVITISIDRNKIKIQSGLWAKESQMLSEDLDENTIGSKAQKLRNLNREMQELRNQLDAPTRKHQEYLTALKEWKIRIDNIETDLDSPDSIASLKNELTRLNNVPQNLLLLEQERLSTTEKIYSLLEELRNTYRDLYRPVQDFINNHSTLAASINLSFDVTIAEQNLASTLSDWINKAKSGTFQGVESGEAKIREIVERTTFNTKESTLDFLSQFLENLKFDQSSATVRPITTSSQLKNNKSVVSFYNFLFGLEFLTPCYVLKLDGKELSELSPGERGLLLLLFYLLVEKNEWPLILDQPEENLDNETVHRVLVPSLQLAKRNRQIIVVTHNPNLAVVADADQIISASIDKKMHYKVEYVSGALENPVANEYVVRYLEGTLPAFMNRDIKYIRKLSPED